ncbi:MAG TPA: undecaprenyl-diphosphate phosphatase [Clostridiales bacterium]|nr:undecaprenyl-diphosphate phosphatase [Clostridiales bacterium]
MSWLKGLLLGLIQGLTEFLPVSSSGHLALTSVLLNGGENFEEAYFSFFVLLHLATLASVIVYYRRDVAVLIKSFFSLLGKLFKGKFRLNEYDAGERTVIMIVMASAPLVLAAAVDGYVEALSSYRRLIGVLLIINGGVLLLSDYLSAKQRRENKEGKKLGQLKPLDALIVGLCQFVAVIPGISRSGATITGGIAVGLERESAVKFSFLLSMPAILGANILKLPDMIKDPAASAGAPAIIAGVIAAFIAGFLALGLLNFIAKKERFRYFAVYCFAVGLLALVL